MPHPPTPGANPAVRSGRTELRLDKGNHLRLRSEQNMRLSAVRGMAWITFERDTDETVVRPGESFVVSSGRTVVVGPLRESVTLELGVAPSAFECAANLSLPILARLRRLFRQGQLSGQ